jgi:hypothetical protein
VADINDRLERLNRREEFARRVHQTVPNDPGVELDDDFAEVLAAVARVVQRHPGMSIMVAAADGRPGRTVMRVTEHDGGVETAVVPSPAAGRLPVQADQASALSGEVLDPEPAFRPAEPPRPAWPAGFPGESRRYAEIVPPTEPYAEPEPWPAEPAGFPGPAAADRYGGEDPAGGHPRPAVAGDDRTEPTPVGHWADPPGDWDEWDGDWDEIRTGSRDAGTPESAAWAGSRGTDGGSAADQLGDQPGGGREGAAARAARAWSVPPRAAGGRHAGEPDDEDAGADDAGGPPRIEASGLVTLPPDTSRVVARLAQMLREDPSLAAGWVRER